MNCYRLFDKKADAYGGIMTAQTDGLMIRQLQDEMQNPESPLAKWTEDFDVYRVGSFKPETPEIQPEQNGHCRLVSTLAALTTNIDDEPPLRGIQGGE